LFGTRHGATQLAADDGARSVRRAVVAHEVTHLVHFNHSPAFHALLAQLFEGSIEEANRWLKRHGRSLYTPLG
jgi:predicted metal-dependent hydrolase